MNDIAVEDVDEMERMTNNSEHDSGELDLQSDFSDIIQMSQSPRSSLSKHQLDVPGTRPQSAKPRGFVLAKSCGVVFKPQAAKERPRPRF